MHRYPSRAVRGHHRAAIWVLSLSVAWASMAALPPSAVAQSGDPASSSGPVPSASPRPDMTPFPADATLPAGYQFGDPESVPRSIAGVNAHAAMLPDGTLAILGTKPQSARPVVMAAVRDAQDGRWSTTTLDDGRTIKGGPGGRLLLNGVVGTAIAGGPHGFVATGYAGLHPGQFQNARQFAGRLWWSPDGQEWHATDTRSILGPRSAYRPWSVAVQPDGSYLVAGSLTDAGLHARSVIALLHSTDGRHWERAGTVKDRWSLSTPVLRIVGDRILLGATEYMCTADSGYQATFTWGGQVHYWSSPDGAGPWTPVDTRDIDAIEIGDRGPSSPRRCVDSIKRLRYESAGDVVGATGDLVVALSEDGTRASSSTDLLTWVTAELPDAAIAGRYPPDRESHGWLVQPDPSGDGTLLLSFERARDLDRTAAPAGQAAIAWRTRDGGRSWEQLPPGPPLLPDAGEWSGWTRLADGSVLLAASSARGGTMQRSVAGSPLPPPSCVPGPAVDCRFVTLDGLDLGGADLHGIRLAGAQLTNVRLDGANLSGADMRDASIQGSMLGADLQDADLVGTRLYGALAGSDLTGARMNGTSLGDWGGPAELRGLDFRTADMAGSVYFSSADLTGSHFGRDQRAKATFFSGNVCPDGKPQGEGFDDPCRLSKR